MGTCTPHDVALAQVSIMGRLGTVTWFMFGGRRGALSPAVAAHVYLRLRGWVQQGYRNAVVVQS